MFDTLKGMAGMAGLLKDLPRIKARMAQVKDDLARVTVHAEAGGGAVRAVASGQLRILSLQLDPSLCAGLADANRAGNREMAQDLIVTAVNVALEKAQARAAQELAAAAQELNLPIPAGALSGLLG